VLRTGVRRDEQGASGRKCKRSRETTRHRQLQCYEVNDDAGLAAMLASAGAGMK
jgi:hypothetical protein